MDAEAEKSLKDWIEIREHGSRGSVLFEEEMGRNGLGKVVAEWNKALEMTGLNQVDTTKKKKQYLNRLYSLRKFFRQEGRGSVRLRIGGIERDVLEAMFGHFVGLDSRYANFNVQSRVQEPTELDELYMRGQRNFWCMEKYEQLVEEKEADGTIEKRKAESKTPLESYEDVVKKSLQLNG